MDGYLRFITSKFKISSKLIEINLLGIKSLENQNLFNHDLNRGCLVYTFSLRFSGSKFLINLRW